MQALRPCPPAPRAYPFAATDALTQFLLLFGGIWAFVGCFMTALLTFVGGPVLGDRTLDQRGLRAIGMPIAVESTQSRVNGRKVQEIRYSFKDRTGASHTASVGSVDEAMIARARAGEPLPIEYDPEEPELTRIHGGSASLIGLLFALPLAFGVAGLVILAFGVRRLLRRRAIYVNGEAAAATVTAVAPSLMRMNRRRVQNIDYVFGAAGAQFTGRATSLVPPEVGSQVWVIYKPDDPRQNVAVPQLH